MPKFLRILLKVLAGLLVLGLIIYLTGKSVSSVLISEDYQSLVVHPVKSKAVIDEHRLDLDSLEIELGNQKIIPEEYRSQILAALSFYPQLKDTRIEFIVEPAVIPISSRPKPSTVFNSKPNRWYCIVISNGGLEGMEEALLENLSFEAQVGVIGHELGHTVFYKDRSSLSLVGLGMAYPFNDFRMKFERETDRRTIDHGLGWQLLKWAEELRPPGSSTEFLDTYYLTPAEIREQMKDSGLYE